jgi:hypothetical protein
MTITCELTKEDYRAFQRHVMFRIRKTHWLYIVMVAGLLLLTWFGGKPEETVTEKIYLLVGTLMLFGLFGGLMMLIFWLVSRLGGARFQGPLGEHVFTITPGSITESSSFGTVETKVAAIRCVDETAKHFFVISAAGIGHIIPKRGLTAMEALRELRAQVKTAKAAK